MDINLRVFLCELFILCEYLELCFNELIVLPCYPKRMVKRKWKYHMTLILNYNSFFPHFIFSCVYVNKSRETMICFKITDLVHKKTLYKGPHSQHWTHRNILSYTMGHVLSSYSRTPVKNRGFLWTPHKNRSEATLEVATSLFPSTQNPCL